MVIKSYRGLLADGGQEKIRLTTTDGRLGYKIVKFQLFPNSPGIVNYEGVGQVFKTEVTIVPTTSATVDFTDSDLLAAAYYQDGSDYYVQSSLDIIFENEIFNQDIYVTHTANESNSPINYYLELEQIKLSTAQAELLIVKSLRGEVWTRP